MKALYFEFYKLRRKKIFLMITLFLGLEIFWALMSVSISMSRNPNSPVWESILSTVASMNGLFLPIICAIVSSRICDMENKGNTWKLLISTGIHRRTIYSSKYLCSCIIMLFGVLLQILTIIFFGIMKDSTVMLSLPLIIKFTGGTMLTIMVILALQQWITLAVKNQAFALCFGMVGGFLGMTSMFFPKNIRLFFIWSYFTELSPVKNHVTNGSFEFIIQNPEISIIATAFLLILIFYIVGNYHFSQQEV